MTYHRKKRKEARHNGEEEREREPCNGDYLHGEKKIVAVQGGIDYLTGWEHYSGSSIDFQVKGIRERAAFYMSAALPYIIEGGANYGN